MAISFTDEFNLNKDMFSRTGAFDVILDVDSLFFIDPKLLEICQVDEFLDSRKK